MKRFFPAAVTIVILVVLAALAYYFYWPGPYAALNGAEKLTVYSLFPVRFPEDSILATKPEVQALAAKPKLHGYPILGQLDISDAKTVTRIKSALNRAMRINPPVRMKCFDPRHAVSIEVSGEQKLDLIICFECGRVVAEGMVRDEQHIGDGPRDLLNQLLDAHGIERDKP